MNSDQPTSAPGSGRANWTAVARRRAVLRSCVAGLIVLFAVAFSAGPASADPARPTNFRSRVLSTSPALPSGVKLEVVGGDAFLKLTVPRGLTAVVPDYSQGDAAPAPYLRFDADGSVFVNELSVAAVINDRRYGAAAGTIDVDAMPRWKRVATSGSYAWHDHRIHWMTPSTPPTMAGSRRIDLGGPEGTWIVELEVDDNAVVATGELLLLVEPSPAPWLGLGIGTAIIVIGLGLLQLRRGRRLPHLALAGALGVLGAAATAVGWAEWQAVPDGAGGSPFTAIVPAVGAAAALVAVSVRAAPLRLAFTLGSVACLGAWAFLRRSVLFHAILPTTLPFPLDKAVTALSLGLAVAVGGLIVWCPPTNARPSTGKA